VIGATALVVLVPAAWASRGSLGLDGPAGGGRAAAVAAVPLGDVRGTAVPRSTAPASTSTSTTSSTTSTTAAPLPTTTAPSPPPPTVPPLPPPPPPPTIRPFYVAVVGDSLIAQSIDDVLAGLVQAGWGADIFGHAGQAIDAPSIQGAAEAAAADPDVDVVVLATASNDNVTNARRADEAGADVALAEYRDRLASRVAPFGDRCVVLVDVRDQAHELFRSSFAPATNAELAQFASTRPNVVVVPWSHLSRDRHDWFIGDGLHFSDEYGDRPATEDHPQGRAAYAAAIVDGVRRCP
jgi:hypothetical protein